MARRQRRPSKKQLAALARGRATRRRNLRAKKHRAKARRRPATTTKRRKARTTTRRSPTVARKKSRGKRRTPRRARGFAFIPPGAPKQVALGTAGFIGVQLIIDKAPIPPALKAGTGRIFAKAGAAVLLGYAVRRLGGMSAADSRAITIGGLMSPTLDIAGTALAKVPGLSGVGGAGLGQLDDLDPLQLADDGIEGEDELAALASRLSA